MANNNVVIAPNLKKTKEILDIKTGKVIKVIEQ